MLLRKNYLPFLFFLINSLTNYSFAQHEKNFEGIIKYLFIPDKQSAYECDTVIHYFGEDNYRIQYKRALPNMDKGASVTDFYYDFKEENVSYYYSYKTGLNRIEVEPQVEKPKYRIAKDSTFNISDYSCFKVSSSQNRKAFESIYITNEFLWVAEDLNYKFPRGWEGLGNGTNKIPLVIGNIMETQISVTEYADSPIEINRFIKWSIVFEILPQELSDSVFKLPE